MFPFTKAYREVLFNDALLVNFKFSKQETYIIYKNKVYDLLNVWLKEETWSRQARPGGDAK
jgi:hypothetical protein